MTRSFNAKAAPLRRSLALSTALGVSLGVLAQPAAGQDTTPRRPTVQNGGVTFANGAAPLVPILPTAVDGTLTTLNVNVLTPKAIVNWLGFDIAAAGTVNFSQLTPNSTVLNRVVTADVSQLAGTMNAPAGMSVWLINTNGIAFGNGAAINVGGLVASTLNITDDNDFLLSNSVRFREGLGATAGITGGSATQPVSINTSNGALVLVAPQINVNTNANVGTGRAAFVLATDASVTTSPGGPLAITVRAGTTLNGNIAGAIVGNRVYALLKPQDGVNALLNLTASVTNATATPTGVVVLSGGGFNATANGDTLNTTANGSATTASANVGNIDLSQSSAQVGAVLLATDAGTLTAARIVSPGNITVGAAGTGPVTVAGNVVSGGNYAVQGSSIRLGTGGTAVFQGVAGTVTLTAPTINTAGTLTIIGDNGLTATGAIGNVAGDTAALTLNAPDAGSAVSIQSSDRAGNLSINAGGAITATTINGAGAVALSSTSTSAAINVTGGVGGTGQVASLQINGGGAVTLGSGGAATVGVNALGDVTVGSGADPASLRVNGSTRAQNFTSSVTGNTVLGAVTTGNDLSVTGTGAGSTITFGGAVNGSGVLTTSAAGQTLFTGAIGTTGTPFASLTTSGAGGVRVNGGAVRTAFSQIYNGGVTLGAATTLTTTSGGELDFGTGLIGAGNDLRLDLAGVGTAGGGITGVRNLLVDSSTGGTTSLAGNISTTGTQIFADATTLATDVTLTSSGGPMTGVTFGSTLGGPRALTVVTPGTLRFAGDVGAGDGNALAAIIATGVATDIEAASVTTTGSQQYGATTLTGASDTIVASIGPGEIGFASVNGPRGLIVEAFRNISLGAVGNTSQLPSLTVRRADAVTATSLNVAGAASFGQTAVLTSLGVSGASSVGTLVVDTFAAANFGSVTATSGDIDVASITGSINFAGAVNGPGVLSVQAGPTGQAVFGGSVGATTAFSSFSSIGAAPVVLNGGSLRTATTQSYGGQLVLGANTVLTGTGATFAGGINGAGGGISRDLTLNFSEAQTLAGGGVAGVRNLTTDAVGSTVLSGDFTTTGTQTFNDLVTLGGATTLLSSGAGAAGAITFNAALDGANELTVTTPGTLSFNAPVGAGSPLVSITTTGAGLTAIRGGTVTTAGAQSYGNTALTGGSDVVLAAGGDIGFTGLSGPRGLTVNTAGTTTLAGGGGAPLAFLTTDAGGTTAVSGTLTTTGVQTFGDNLSLSGDTTLAGELATFGAGVTGNGNDLTINTSGPQVLNGTITGVGNLTTDAAGTLTLNGSITTAGAQSFGEAVLLGSAVALSGSAITFGGTLDGAQTLTASAGLTSFNGDVGTGTALTSLGIDGATAIGGAGARTVRTTGAQKYVGTLTLNSDATLIGDGALFAGVIDGTAANRSLTLTFAGPTTLTTGSLTNVGNLLLNGAGTATLGGTIETVGSQTYLSALQLGAATTLASTGGQAITLNAVGGEQALTVNTAGLTTFNAGAAGLLSIETDAGGSTVLNGTMLTTNAQRYADGVVLGSAVTVESSNGGALTFAGSVTGAQDLTVATKGLTTFGGAVSVATLASTGPGAVLAEGGAITTATTQSYVGQLQLGANLTLTGTGGTFGGGVLGNNFDLALDFSGPTVIAGGFAGINNLASGGGGTTTLSGVIETAGGQAYADLVTLAGPTTLRSGDGTGTGAISFGAALDGGQALTVTTGGLTSFAGPVGTATPLASLAVNGTGAVAINGGAVTTTGTQGYAGATTLGQSTTLVTDGGDIAFGSSVSGPVQLSVRTSPAGVPVTGAVSFGGAATLDALVIRADTASAASAANRVGTLAAAINGGGFSFGNATALTVGTVDGVNGIAVGTGAQTLTAAGLLTLAADTSARMTTLTGVGIVQNAGVMTDAGSGAITLDAQDGPLTLAGTLATTNAGSAAVRLLDAGATQLGTISTGAGGTLSLGGAAGNSLSTVTQAAGTTLTAGTLTGNVDGAAVLTNGNAIGVLGAFSAGSLQLRNAGALAVDGPVNTVGTLGLQTDAGGLLLNGNVTAGGTTTFIIAGGIVQSASSSLITPTLTGSTGGSVLLIGTNQIGNFAGFSVGGGGLTFNSALPLTLAGDLTVTGTLNLSALGIDFTGRTISVTGSVSLDGQAGAVTGANLSATGDTSVSGGTVTLGTANAGTGALTIKAQNALTLGTGTAGRTIALSSESGTLSATTLTAGAAGAVGNATQITTSSGSATTIGSATSNNGGVSVTGGSASVTAATAINGALSLTTTAGPLQLGTGIAGTTATLTAAGPLTVSGSLTGAGDAQAVATGAAGIAAITSSGGNVLVRGSTADVTEARAARMLSVEATSGNATLTTGVAGGDASVLASGGATVGTLGTIPIPVGGAVTITAKGGDAIVGTTVATGAATLAASGLVQAGTLNGGSVTGIGGSVDVANATSASTLALTASATMLRLGTGLAGGAATLTAVTTLDATTLTAGGLATTTSGGATTIGTVSGTGVSVSGTSVTVGQATASAGDLLLRATDGAVSLTDGQASGAATLDARGPLTVGTALRAGGNVALTAVDAITAGTLTSTGGAITAQGRAVTVTGTDAQTSLEVTATGGDVSLTNGIARTGNATVRATGAVGLGTLSSGGTATITASGGDLTGTAVTAGGTATATAANLLRLATLSGAGVSGTGRTVEVTGATAAGNLQLTANGGALTLNTGSATGSAMLSAAGPLTVLTSLNSTGNATASAGGVATVASISSAAGNASVSGQSALVTTASAAQGLTVSSTGGALTLGTGTATSGTATLSAAGPLTVTTGLTSGGNATVTADGNVSIASIASTGGNVAISGQSAEVTTANAGQALTVSSTGGELRLGTGTATGTATLSAAGPLTVLTSISGTGGASATASGVATIASITSTGGNVAVSGQSAQVTAANAGQALTVSSTGGELRLGTGTATGVATLSAAGPLTVLTSLSGAGGASASASGLATIASISSTGGNVAVSGQSAQVAAANAGQALTVTSTGGALTLGTGTAMSGAATLNAAGPLTVTTGLTSGGNASATATGAATIAAITSTNGGVAVSGQSASVTTAAAAQGLTVASTGGALTLGTGSATAGGATLSAAGPLAVTAGLTSGGNASVTAAGPATVAAITSTNGAVAVSAASASVTAATARTTLDLLATGGDLTLVTGNAGGAATLRATGAVRSTSLTTTGGGTASLTAGTTLNSGTLNAGGAATLVAGGAATLGATTSGAAVAVTAASITAGQTGAGTTLALTSTGNLALAGGSAGGNATFDAGGTATLGQVLAGSAATLSVRALDAAITGIQRAGTVQFTNRAPATAAVKLGDGASAGGFALSQTEVNFVEAGQLTLDAGAGNVEIGTLAFDADAGRTRVDVLATGRVDVGGAVSGTGAARSFRFGGNAGGTDAKASVIRVSATSTAGGRLLFDTADLDLRGVRIGVGQQAGFLDPIGFGSATGLSAAEVAGAYVGNANSALYNASFGGTPYAVDSVLLSARSLTVRYTDYALFQNTGVPGQNAGVQLGSVAGGPASGSLVVQGPGATTSAFALFGTIGGISNTSTAVLGPSIISTLGIDQANTRINGCLVGTGAGCLTAVVTQPLLAIFDSSQAQVFIIAEDLVVPFDPVVGSGNEALFSGIGSIDSGISDTECGPGATNPACSQAQEQGK